MQKIDKFNYFQLLWTKQSPTEIMIKHTICNQLSPMNSKYNSQAEAIQVNPPTWCILLYFIIFSSTYFHPFPKQLYMQAYYFDFMVKVIKNICPDIKTLREQKPETLHQWNWEDGLYKFICLCITTTYIPSRI